MRGCDLPSKTCSSDGCSEPAVEWLMLRGQAGHIHDCSEHTHDVREWCDVTHSGPMMDDHRCPLPICTAEFIFHGQPSPLEVD